MQRIIIYTIVALTIASMPSLSVYTRVEDSLPIRGTVTAYSSEVGQTDDTPFITASNQRVRDGIIANNCLPFGTQIRYKGRVYEVQDRMNSRYGCLVFDIWFADTEEAWVFGSNKDQHIAIILD